MLRFVSIIWCIFSFVFVARGQQTDTLYTKFVYQKNLGVTQQTPFQQGYPAQNEQIIAGINKTRGQDCCNECLFLPNLLPCAHFINAVSYSRYIFRGDGTAVNSAWDNPDTRGLFPPFVQFDDQIMCFQQGGTDPWPLFGVYYNYPQLLTGTPITLITEHEAYPTYCSISGCRCGGPQNPPERNWCPSNRWDAPMSHAQYGASQESVCGPSPVASNTLGCTQGPKCGDSGCSNQPTITGPGQCILGNQVLLNNAHSPNSSAQNQYQFINTLYYSYDQVVATWVLFYRQTGQAITGYMYDIGDQSGHPSTNAQTAGTITGTNLPEYNVTTLCNSSGLCVVPLDNLSFGAMTPIQCPILTFGGYAPRNGGYITSQCSCGMGSYLTSAAFTAATLPVNPPESHAVWCDAPNDSGVSKNPPAPNSPCTGPNVIFHYEYVTSRLDLTGGCLGYGVCPQDVNGVVCGGQGSCKHNAKCFCNAGWGGLACDKPIPQLNVTNATYTCSQFDPCSENGMCTDTVLGPVCLCYDGWRGSPANGRTLDSVDLDQTGVNGEINIYNHAFFCNQPSCSGWRQAYLYMLDHQCLFFVDPNGVFIRRYLRTSSNPADNPIVDSRSLNHVYSFYSPQPLWYSGPTDIQITGKTLAYSPGPGWDTYAPKQVVVRGFNCIDGRNVTDKTTLPPEDLPNGVLRGGPGCLPCPPCNTNNSVCVSAVNQGYVFTRSTAQTFVVCALQNYIPYLAAQIPSIVSESSCPVTFNYVSSIVTWWKCLSWKVRSACSPIGVPAPFNKPNPICLAEGAIASTIFTSSQNIINVINSGICGSVQLGSCDSTQAAPYDCSSAIYSVVRYCQCNANFGHSNSTNTNSATCDMQICPQNGTSTPCGAPTNGICITTGGTGGYVGYCQCYKGFEGDSCQFQTCPSTGVNATSPPVGLGANLMCGGFEAGVTNIAPGQASTLSIAPALDCITSSGTCVCNGPFWRLNPLTGLCDLVGCSVDATGQECHGLVLNGITPNSHDPNHTLINVCDRVRNPTTNLGTCQCYKARQLSAITDQQPTLSFYGTACTLPYNTPGVCVSPTTGSYCGNSSVAGCYLTGSNTGGTVADPTAAPTCHCPSSAGGQWCDQSLCNPAVAPGLDCSNDPFAPTGVCEGWKDCPTHDNNCYSPTCMSSQCQWKCLCYYVDPANNYQICPSITNSPSPTCVYYSNIDSMNPGSAPGIACVHPLTGCTYYDANRSPASWTVCGYVGQSACMPNSTGTGLACNCTGTQYSGTYCQTQQGCGGYCLTTGSRCLNTGACQCGSTYTGSTTGCTSGAPCCATPTCGGAYPGNFTTSTATCSCPTGSNYVQPGGNNQYATPYCYNPNDGNFKGCAWACPTYMGAECGGCSLPKYNNGFSSRCSSHTIYAFSNNSAPTCDCTALGYDYVDTQVPSNVLIPWTKSSNGACEPYCYPLGGTYTGILHGTSPWNETQYIGSSAICTCSNGWTGSRCNVSTAVCHNGGVLTHTTSPPSCICGNSSNPNLPYTSASNCTIATCNAAISNYTASLYLDRCTCFPPYSYADTTSVTCSNVCLNSGTPNLTTGNCSCGASVYYGQYCEFTDCTNSNPTPTSCVCASILDQFDSTTSRCEPISCINGVENWYGTCSCFDMFSGQFCETDMCNTLPSYGVAILNTSANDPADYYCECNPGYTADASGLCTIDACGPYGILIPCPTTGFGFPICPFPAYPYQCACGNGTFDLDPNTGIPTCLLPDCAFGELSSFHGLGVCTCYPGFINDAVSIEVNRRYCDTYACDVFYYPYSYWDTAAKSCQCYPPFSGAPTCLDYNSICGPGSGFPVSTNNLTALGWIGQLPLWNFITNTAPWLSESYLCNCSVGYYLSSDETVFVNGIPPCVVNCSQEGTAHAWPTYCECLDGYNGTYCENAPTNTVIIAPSSSSSTGGLANWAWALVAIGIGVALLVIVFSICRFVSHRKPEWWHRRRKVNNKYHSSSSSSSFDTLQTSQASKSYEENASMLERPVRIAGVARGHSLDEMHNHEGAEL